MAVATPHELLMALEPESFPWECKIVTSFPLLLEKASRIEIKEEKDDDVEENKEENC